MLVYLSRPTLWLVMRNNMIQPLGTKIQLELEKPTAGALNLDSKKTAVEVGTVLAVGDKVKNFKVGDKLMVKAWQIDIISYEDVEYNFVDEDATAICAIIK